VLIPERLAPAPPLAQAFHSEGSGSGCGMSVCPEHARWWQPSAVPCAGPLGGGVRCAAVAGDRQSPEWVRIKELKQEGAVVRQLGAGLGVLLVR